MTSVIIDTDHLSWLCVNTGYYPVPVTLGPGALDQAQMMAVVSRSRSDIKWQEQLNRITANLRWTEAELWGTFVDISTRDSIKARVSRPASIWSRKDICTLIRQIIALRHNRWDGARRCPPPWHWSVVSSSACHRCHAAVSSDVTPNVKTQTCVWITKLLIRLELLDVIRLLVLRRLLVIDKMIRFQHIAQWTANEMCHEQWLDTNI